MIKITAIEEHNKIRMDFWMKVYIAYVGASNSSRKEQGAEWADEALKQFDERFKPSI